MAPAHAGARVDRLPEKQPEPTPEGHVMREQGALMHAPYPVVDELWPATLARRLVRGRSSTSGCCSCWAGG